VTAPLRIESTSRWDALALARRLGCYHRFLVELGPQHWDVCVTTDDPSDALPAEIADSVVQWLHERRLEQATVHLAATDVVLTRD
jgi:hypothetical protein